MMGAEGAAFVERYRVALGDSEAAVEKKARALATDLALAFRPISKKADYSARAHNVGLTKDKWNVTLYNTLFTQRHKAQLTFGDKRYSCEVAAAFAADILQYEGAGAFGLAYLNFPKFAALYRDAPLTNEAEYKFRLDECKTSFGKKGT
jgi:hypothetical protein